MERVQHQTMLRYVREDQSHLKKGECTLLDTAEPSKIDQEDADLMDLETCILEDLADGV